VPYWVQILSAAGGDPLRAQEIEEQVTLYWWERYLIYSREKNRAAEEERKRLASK
jgi:hypothetical protein